MFLGDVKELDDIQLGCLAVKLSTGKKAKRFKLEQQCIARKWVRIEPRDDIWGRTLFLTTLGLKAWKREEERRNVHN